MTRPRSVLCPLVLVRRGKECPVGEGVAERWLVERAHVICFALKYNDQSGQRILGLQTPRNRVTEWHFGFPLFSSWGSSRRSFWKLSPIERSKPKLKR